MATSGSPLRGNSRENRPFYQSNFADSTYKRVEHRVEYPERVERVHVIQERENLGPESGRYRSRSPVHYAATR